MTQFKKIIGCGGIGKGLLFHSSIEETLGRNESRLVELSDAKDYCKLQIVFYYVSMLVQEKINIYLLGAVGQDSFGKEMLGLLEEQGMNTDHIIRDVKRPTMLSICLQYPDKEGCNFSAINSASELVTPHYIRESCETIGIDRETIVAAIPEVPLKSRFELLKQGHQAGALCVTSIPAAEAEEFEKLQVYKYCDILAVNEEEAIAICKSNRKGRGLAEDLIKYLKQWNGCIKVCITCGGAGSYCGDTSQIDYIPALPVEVLNTTGAGDCFIGVIIGTVASGMPFFMNNNHESNVIQSAPQLAAICAGLAVEYQDSIPFQITKEYIQSTLNEKNLYCPFSYLLN